MRCVVLRKSPIFMFDDPVISATVMLALPTSTGVPSTTSSASAMVIMLLVTPILVWNVYNARQEMK